MATRHSSHPSTPLLDVTAGDASLLVSAQLLKMHELIEGLSGIEVVVDDFIVIGCGSTVEEATVDHDKVLMAFLERCKEQGVKLNTDKLNLRMTEVPFIGHIATDKGLRVDPVKVRRSVKCQLQQTKLEFRDCWGLRNISASSSLDCRILQSL